MFAIWKKVVILIKMPAMEYRNQFHKESTERKLKQIEERKKSPPPLKESASNDIIKENHIPPSDNLK